MKVAISAGLIPGEFGGVQSAVAELVSALGRLEDGEEEYLVVCLADRADWVRPYLSDRVGVIERPQKSPRWSASATWRRAGRYANRFLGRTTGPEVPHSRGYFESLGCEVVHFMTQRFEISALPSVYNPHDLQHRHLPEFFTDAQISWRDSVYGAGCRRADSVCVASHWVKDDLVKAYNCSPSKIRVIPWAPVTAAVGRPDQTSEAELRARYVLPRSFALYPAVTWPHKNHLRLVEALARMRSSTPEMHLVFTGYQTDHWIEVKARIEELSLESRVHHLGVIPTEDLRALYSLCVFVIVPTLFEAVSGPLYEAWVEGAPAAVSAVTALPEQAGDAALLFDPSSVTEIADVMKQLATDSRVRQELRDRGRRRLNQLDWRTMGKSYRAVYRKAAGRALEDDDRQLLDSLSGTMGTVA